MNKLYALPFSHPSIAARLILERAGVPHEIVNLPLALHPLFLRALGFPGNTVPALVLDGRKVQGSLSISRALEARGPAGILFPVDPGARARVEEAERWGESVLQPVPRRLFRWTMAGNPLIRRRVLERAGLPLAGIAATVMKPVLARFARVVQANDSTVHADMQGLDDLLDRVDELIAEGTIGGAEPNAADFQIATSLAAMLAFEDLIPRIEGRPAADLARRLVPPYPGRMPAVVPAGWIRRAA
ncbi:MAG TPA: glutathione S-transferase [Gemmatimonadota bacterium]|nr:glutathione S-transferase [Gemmatimonadota bacterium]